MLQRIGVASRAGWLLTGLPSHEVNAFRRWYRAEVEAQLGGRPPRPCPFPSVPEHEAGGSEPTGDLSPDVLARRHEQLVFLQAALSEAPDSTAVADALVTAAIGSLERSRGMVCLLEADSRTVEVVAPSRFPDDIVRAWRTFSLFADLPASECIRTLRIVTLPTRAERHRRFPLISARPITEDSAVVCVPLRGHGRDCLSGAEFR